MDKLILEDIELASKFELHEFTLLDNLLLHKLFELLVDEKACDIASVTSEDSLTYNELNDRTNCIENSLINNVFSRKQHFNYTFM